MNEFVPSHDLGELLTDLDRLSDELKKDLEQRVRSDL